MIEPAAIEVERLLPHSPAAVWRTLTEPALIARWWAPGDVRAAVGHRFELDMGPWGKQACEVLEAEPERLFRYRFAPGTLDTVVSFRLAPEAGGASTRLTLRHEGFKLDTPMGRGAYEGMKPGWPGVLAKLEGVLAA